MIRMPEGTKRPAKLAWTNYTLESKNLKNFLDLYYLSYIVKLPEQKKYRGPRKPKKYPGLRFIQRMLLCSKSTAENYLRGLDTAHYLFQLEMSQDSHEKPNEREIRDPEYKELLKKNIKKFERIAKCFGVNRNRRNATKIRSYLEDIADNIEDTKAFFSATDTANFFRELASWFY